MHQQGGTIEGALKNIESYQYVLPAIQREFVWQPEQVCNLFDSLMQGFRLASSCIGKWRHRTPVSTVGTTLCGTITSGIILIALNWE